MREYLFAASTGFFVIDKPASFDWHSGELSQGDFVLVRATRPTLLKELADRHNDLVNRRYRLKQPLQYSGMHNIWLDGVLEKTPERDWLPVPEYVVLRTGRRCKEEDELMGCVIEGDRVFHTPQPSNPEAKGMLLTIVSIDPRHYTIQRDLTLQEALTCPRT